MPTEKLLCYYFYLSLRNLQIKMERLISLIKTKNRDMLAKLILEKGKTCMLTSDIIPSGVSSLFRYFSPPFCWKSYPSLKTQFKFYLFHRDDSYYCSPHRFLPVGTIHVKFNWVYIFIAFSCHIPIFEVLMLLIFKIPFSA